MNNTFCRARGIASLLEDLTLLFWLDFFFLFYLSSFESLIHTRISFSDKNTFFRFRALETKTADLGRGVSFTTEKAHLCSARRPNSLDRRRPLS